MTDTDEQIVLTLAKNLRFFGEDPSARLRCQPLASGDHNIVWRVQCAERDVVIRLPMQTPQSIAFYRAEFFNHHSAFQMGLAPKIWAENTSSGLLVCDYVPGNSVARSDFQKSDFCRMLVAALRQLHDSGHWFLYQHDFMYSIKQKVKRYLSLTCVELPGTLYKMTLIAESLRNRLAQETVQLVPIHGDLALRNMMLVDNGLSFIDWEVSGMGDRLEELAYVIFSSDITPAEAISFIELYYGAGLPKPFSMPLEKVICRTVVYWLLHIYRWAVEHSARTSHATDADYERQCQEVRIAEFRALLQTPLIRKILNSSGYLTR